MGLIDLIQKGLGIERSEFKPTKLKDSYGNSYLFNGKLMTRVCEEIGGGQCSFHYWTGLGVYKTEDNKFVLECPYTRKYIKTVDEEELFEYINSMEDKEDFQKRVKAKLALRLYEHGMNCFAELAENVPREVVVE